MTDQTHSLHPLPQRLARLLVKGDRHLPTRIEAWMSRHSEGRYPFLHRWLDDEDNLPERVALGARVCEIIESGELTELDS